MLKKLTVKHFAIIDDVTLMFQPGMTVLTGETGAGKSLIIDAIGLLLGDRAQQEMIRSNETWASVEGIVSIQSERLRRSLMEHNISFDNDEFVIYRELSVQNKNIIKINQQSVTLQQLKEIALHFADLHSQFDTQKLMTPTYYLELIDGYKKDGIRPYLERYRIALNAYQQALSDYHSLLQKQKSLLEKEELYRFQYQELSLLDLKLDEEEALKQSASQLENYDKINTLIAHVLSLFEDGLSNQLYDLSHDLESLHAFGMNLETEATKAKDAYYELDDIQSTLIKQQRQLAFDPDELNRIEERLAILEKIQSKYHQRIPELIEYLNFLKNSLDQTDHYDDYLEASKSSVLTTHKELVNAAQSISAYRIEGAKRLRNELLKTFDDLMLPNMAFEIEFSHASFDDPLKSDGFSPNGIDAVDFLISTNVGESLKPLSKIASGGEMSRIMLAFKTIYVKSQQLSTMIFDEIDTGISGAVAKQIARKIKSIAYGCQVLAISHVPQVVAMADRQLNVTKHEQNHRTVAEVSELTFDERVLAIAQMMAGLRVNQATLDTAKTLLLEQD